MNSGDSNDLNCIRIDPQTGEKFSFNVDIHSGHGVEHPQHIHTRSFIHFIQWESFLFFVLCITSLSTNEIGRYLTYLEYLPERKSAARGMILGRWQLSGSMYVFLIVTSYTLTLNWLTARLRERPAAFPSFARYDGGMARKRAKLWIFFFTFDRD